MKLRITFCTECDKTKYPKELIKWEGKCESNNKWACVCGKDTKRIALFDTDDGVKSLLKEGKK